MKGATRSGRAAAGAVLFGLFLASAARGEAPALRDGIYEGEHSFVAVAVTVSGGKIASIEMTRHGGGGEKYAGMVRPLLARMVEQQTVEVDAVAGATVSSSHLKKAVADALGKAALPE